ncbi:MAG: hypothetical protein ACYC9L_05510 [Sulfuricaulis sp.]
MAVAKKRPAAKSALKKIGVDENGDPIYVHVGGRASSAPPPAPTPVLPPQAPPVAPPVAAPAAPAAPPTADPWFHPAAPAAPAPAPPVAAPDPWFHPSAPPPTPAPPTSEPPPPAGGPQPHTDGTVDSTTGGIWYANHLYQDPNVLKALFPSDDAWRAFLNTNTGFRDWNASWAAAHPTTPTAPGGGDTTGTGAATKGPPVDWSAVYWGGLGLPTDVVSQINKIFSQYPDVTVAQALAQQYLRGTPWYQTTFPGIQYGIRNGLFTDETGYRRYVTELNQHYQAYTNQPVTGTDVASWLQQGKDSTYVGNYFKGNAIAQTEAPDLNYESGAFTPQGQLTSAERQAYGQEKAGIDTPLGQQILQRMQQADQRLAGVFRGSLATPGFSLGPQGLYAPALQGSKEGLGKGGLPDLPA